MSNKPQKKMRTVGNSSYSQGQESLGTPTPLNFYPSD